MDEAQRPIALHPISTIGQLSSNLGALLPRIAGPHSLTSRWRMDAVRGIMALENDHALTWFLVACFAVLIVLAVLAWLFG